MHCQACGRLGSAQLDAGELLWAQIERGARGVLLQVHLLASTYGWTESEVLSLSAERRAAYLAWAGA